MAGKGNDPRGSHYSKSVPIENAVKQFPLSYTTNDTEAINLTDVQNFTNPSHRVGRMRQKEMECTWWAQLSPIMSSGYYVLLLFSAEQQYRIEQRLLVLW